MTFAPVSKSEMPTRRVSAEPRRGWGVLRWAWAMTPTASRAAKIDAANRDFMISVA
jgi:hypothetical protein